MADPVHVATHGFAIAIGFAIKDWFRSGPSIQECPACLVTCGTLTCPQVSCTTGHIELGPYATLLLGLVISCAFICLWWIKALYRKTSTTVSPEPRRLVDGRRLGAAIGWRPDARD